MYSGLAMKFTDQIKQRRLALGLKQKDMKMRIGMDQQQYQSIEADGNPRLNTLALIAEGLEAELMLVPKNKARAVQQLLKGEVQEERHGADPEAVEDDPWSGLLDE